MPDQNHPDWAGAQSPQRGFIVFDEGDGDRSIGCLVRSISLTGANLEFENPRNVPARFFFHRSDWDSGKDSVVIWRMGSLIGVEFSG